MKNYYKILGVSQTATLEAIKRAYREKAKKYHPDVNNKKKSKEQFQLINEAYQVLKNEQKRKIYDSRFVRVQQRHNPYYKQRTRPAYKRTDPYKRRYYYRPGYNNNREQQSKAEKKFEKIFDNILFLFMLLVGIYAFGFGLYRTIFSPVDGINSIAGLISGLIFTIVIIYGWKQRLKK